MKIPITRSIKITLLKWLQNGYIETNDIAELRNSDVDNNLPDYIMDELTQEEIDLLARIGQKILKEEFP